MDFADHTAMAGSPQSCTRGTQCSIVVTAHAFLNHVFAPKTSSEFYFRVVDKTFNPQHRAVRDALDRRPFPREMASRLTACPPCTPS